MLDRDGYRPNVAIVVVNGRNQVFWGKRIREHSWQFPQGGINAGETPEQAMVRGARDQERVAGQLQGPEADLVPLAPDRARQRRVVARDGQARVRRVALARLLD